MRSKKSIITMANQPDSRRGKHTNVARSSGRVLIVIARQQRKIITINSTNTIQSQSSFRKSLPDYAPLKCRNVVRWWEPNNRHRRIKANISFSKTTAPRQQPDQFLAGIHVPAEAFTGRCRYSAHNRNQTRAARWRSRKTSEENP